MSINVKKFINTNFYDWFVSNIDDSHLSSFSTREEFWITPVDKKDPSYKDVVDDLLKRFKDTTVGGQQIVEGLALVVIREGTQVYVCGVYLDGRRTPVLSDSLVEGLSEASLSFLQNMLINCKFGVKTKAKISPSIWRLMPIFQADLDEFTPKIVCLEVSESLKKDSDDILILKFLLSLDLPARNVIALRNEMIDVMLAIPLNGHEWLSRQFLWTAMAGRNSNFFIELYRIVEFFFPLSKISKLKDTIGFSGSNLQLLSACSSELGWNVNHALGSRLALNFATIDFAEIALAKTFSEGQPDATRKFKEDAMEKITELRHALIHQSFKEYTTEDEILARYTRAMLVFLSTSFINYEKKSS